MTADVATPEPHEANPEEPDVTPDSQEPGTETPIPEGPEETPTSSEPSTTPASTAEDPEITTPSPEAPEAPEATFTFGTWNLYYDYVDMYAPVPWSWRHWHVAETIVEAGVQVFSTQETSANQVADLLRDLRSIDPAADWQAAQAPQNDPAIFYQGAVFSRDGASGLGAQLQPHAMYWTQLTHKASGVKFIAGSAHWHGADPSMCLKQAGSDTRAATKVMQLLHSPAIIGMDTNDYDYDGRGDLREAINLFKGNSFKDLREAYPEATGRDWPTWHNWKAQPPWTASGQAKNEWIDEIFTSSGMTVTAGGIYAHTLPIETYLYSDHHLLTATVTVTNEESAAEKAGWELRGGRWFYVSSDGSAATGWLSLNGNWYYLGDDGAMVTGWQFVGGHWYYLSPSGVMTTGWVSANGRWYYLNLEGAMTTGWQFVNGNWYYLNADGSLITGWQFYGGHWYYLNHTGAMATGWQSIGGSWYYLSANGTMATAWQLINGNWYYLGTDGRLVTGWLSVGGNWYYLSHSGALATGWQSISGYWYYLNADGTMTTGWQLINGSWYYLSPGGTMVTGSQRIGGVAYSFASDGRMSN